MAPTTTVIDTVEKKEGLLPSRRISAVYNAHEKQSTIGATNIRIVALACGMGLIASTALLWTRWIVEHRFSWFELFVSMIAFGVGTLSFILEGNILFFEERKIKIITRIPNLGQVSGRGAMYTGVGLLQCSVFHPLNLFVGLFTAIVGLYMIKIGQNAAKSLSTLKTSITDEKSLLAAFQANDQNGDGVLEMFEFDGVLLQLGLELDQDELDAAFSSIDTNNDKKIVYDEFRMWWKACTADAESGIMV